MERKGAYEAQIKNMPVGLDRAILRVLSYHRGREQAIGRSELVRQVAQLGCAATERQVREEIKQLRRGKNGQEPCLICSAAGEDGGYYLANSRQEYEEFAQIEFVGKIADMSETLHAMEQAARRMFGDAVQPGLF